MGEVAEEIGTQKQADLVYWQQRREELAGKIKVAEHNLSVLKQQFEVLSHKTQSVNATYRPRKLGLRRFSRKCEGCGVKLESRTRAKKFCDACKLERRRVHLRGLESNG